MLNISLFASPEIRLDGQVIRLPRRKSRALLYYLAGHARPLAREHLLAFFWPDTPRPAAQQTLRTTLHGMRQVLGEAVVVEANAVGLAPEVEVDARLFEARLSAPSAGLPAL